MATISPNSPINAYSHRGLTPIYVGGGYTNIADIIRCVKEAAEDSNNAYGYQQPMNYCQHRILSEVDIRKFRQVFPNLEIYHDSSSAKGYYLIRSKS